MIGVCVHANPADRYPTQFARNFKICFGLTSPRQFGTSERGADRNYARRWQRMERNILHTCIWRQILASLRSSIIAHVWTRAPRRSNWTMVNLSKGIHYIHRIFAHCMHIWAWHGHFPQFYCLTFEAETASGLPQSWSADQHGWNTAAIQWDLWNGPTCTFHGTGQTTSKLENVTIFIKIWLFDDLFSVPGY